MSKLVGIVGYGHVGGIMHKLFPNAEIYDEPLQIGKRININECDYAFICVPTPQNEDGSCNTSIVDDVLSWLCPKKCIIIRSTVPVGYTRKWVNEGKHIIFQPEYYGETKKHMFEDPNNRDWITLGGLSYLTEQVAQLYETVFTSKLRINQIPSDEAEFAKYMENSFFSTKVIFCNQFYDLAKAMGVNYVQAREAWLMDPRIDDSHTQVYPFNQGYGGKCLPKDTAAIIYQGDKVGVNMSLLKAVEEANARYHEMEV